MKSMKRLILLALVAITSLLFSCNRKQIIRETKNSDEIRQVFEEKKHSIQVIDTSKREDMEVVYTKVEYYPPGESAYDSTYHTISVPVKGFGKSKGNAKPAASHPP